VSPKSRGRKPKKSGSSKRTSKRRSPAAGPATAVDPGYGSLRIELPRSQPDDVLLQQVPPDQFGPSHRRVLTESAALLRAGGPRALEQATAELIGAELRNPEVQGLRFDLWALDLIESARNRVLSDAAWNNDTWQGPWWLLHGLASIGSYGLGGHAAQQAAEAAKSLPRAALAQQPDWLALMPDIEATGDMHVLRDVYGTRFGVIAGFAYPGGIDPSVYMLGFDASVYLGLAAAGVFDDAEPAVTAWRDQVDDSAPGVEPVTVEVLAWLSHAEHSEGLIDERSQGAVLDDYFRGPRRIQDMLRKLGGRRAELPQGDPEAVQEAFTAWYSTRHHGDVPDQDAVEAVAEEWLGVMLPGTEHAVSPRRSAAFRDQITSWWDDEDAAGALSLLPEWIRWNGEQAGMPPNLISDAVAVAVSADPEDADEP
jgi:hypothetical protein